MNNTTTYNAQSPFDIALQEYGSIEGIFDLLAANPGLEFDSDIASGTVLGLGGEIVKQEVADYYTNNSIKPATGNIEDLMELTENDGGMITKTYNYNLAAGDKTFDGIRLYNLLREATVQINYSGIDTDDVKLILESSLDGINYSPIMEAEFTIDKNAPSHTFMLLGLVTAYIRLKVVVPSATVGTIDEMIILV